MRIIAGLYKGRLLHSPKGDRTRPTSGRMREALFNICQNYIEGARFLDLFAGSGAMGFEALSRGASFATFVDNSQESVRCIKKNRELLQLEQQSELLFGDVFEVMQKLAKKEKKYDLIYADPPYGTNLDGVAFSHLLVSKLDALIEANCTLLNEKGMLFIEEDEKNLSSLKSKHLKLISSRSKGRSGLQQYSIGD